ncbi:MAG: hypothetical protein ABIH34_03335 [Nanoarchaeota archaeon]
MKKSKGGKFIEELLLIPWRSFLHSWKSKLLSLSVIILAVLLLYFVIALIVSGISSSLNIQGIQAQMQALGDDLAQNPGLVNSAKQSLATINFVFFSAIILLTLIVAAGFFLNSRILLKKPFRWKKFFCYYATFITWHILFLLFTAIIFNVLMWLGVILLPIFLLINMHLFVVFTLSFKNKWGSAIKYSFTRGFSVLPRFLLSWILIFLVLIFIMLPFTIITESFPALSIIIYIPVSFFIAWTMRYYQLLLS